MSMRFPAVFAVLATFAFLGARTAAQKASTSFNACSLLTKQEAAAAIGFDRGADVYERSRPSYSHFSTKASGTPS